MSGKTAPVWAYSLPSTLALMVPFDLLASLAMDVYLPVTPQMPTALQTSTTLVQLTLSVYILILGLGQLLFGPLSDRIGRRPVVLGGTVLFSVASFSLAMTDDGAVFLALRTLQALGASAALVATFATVRDVFAGRPESITLYGLFSSILSFVPALGPILGAGIALGFGWRAIFSVLGILGLAALLHAWPRWQETRIRTDKRHRTAFRSILTSRSFWVYTLGYSTAMGAFFVFFSISPAILINRAGFSQISFSLAFSTVAGVMILSTRFVGFFVKRWGIAGCFTRGAMMIAAGAGLLAALSGLNSPGVVTVVMPMWGIAIGLVLLVSVSANGALQGFDETAGTAVALYYGVQSLIVSGLGTAMTVIFPPATVWPLVAYCALTATASLIGMTLLKRRQEV